MSEGAGDPEAAEASMPTPGQVTDATDLPRFFAGPHEGTEDAFNVLRLRSKKSVYPTLTKHTQAEITGLFARKYINFPQNR